MGINPTTTPRGFQVLEPKQDLPGPEETLAIGLWAYMRAHPRADYTEFQRARERMLRLLEPPR